MANFLLKFTNRSGRIRICTTVQGTIIRNYQVEDGLDSPNLGMWDAKAQRFIPHSDKAQKNNAVQNHVMEVYQRLLKEREFDFVKELFTCGKSVLSAS